MTRPGCRGKDKKTGRIATCGMMTTTRKTHIGCHDSSALTPIRSRHCKMRASARPAPFVRPFLHPAVGPRRRGRAAPREREKMNRPLDICSQPLSGRIHVFMKSTCCLDRFAFLSERSGTGLRRFLTRLRRRGTWAPSRPRKDSDAKAK
jgi:hypothetical protein